MALQKEQAQVEVIINGQKATATIADMDKAVKTLNTQIRNLEPGTEAFIKKTEELQKIKTRLNDVKTSVNGVKQETGNMIGQLEKLGPAGAILANVKNGFMNIAGSAGQVVRACLTVSGAMIAIPVFALVAGITALVAYFKSTDEGADKVEQALAGVKAVFDVLIGVVSKFGGLIVDAFKNPKKTIMDIAEFIGNNIINRFTAFKVILEGIIDLDFEKLANGFIQMGTGVEDATGKAKKLGAALEETVDNGKKAAQAAIDLTKRTQDLEDAERDLSVINSKRKNEIDTLLLKYRDQTLSVKERQEALKRAGQIEKEMTEDSLKLANESLDIIKKQNKLKTDSIEGAKVSDEDKDKQAAAETRINEILGERNKLNQEIRNRESTFITQEQNQRKKALDDQQKKEEEIRKNILKLEMDALTDSLEDKKKKLNLQATEEINQLKGTEEQKAIQKKSIEQKLAYDIAAIEKQAADDALKVKQENDKKAYDIEKRSALAKAQLMVDTAGNPDDLLAAQKNQLELQQKYELDNTDLTENEKALIKQKYRQQQADAEEQARQARIQAEKQTAEQIGGLAQQGIQDIEDFSHIKNQKQLTEIDQTKNKRIATLDADLKARKITDEQYNKAKAEAEAEADKKSKAIKQRQAQGDKRAAVVSAIINTFLSTIKALPNIPLAIAAAATGAVATAKIIATPLPTFKFGGWLKSAWAGLKSFFNGGIIRGSKHGPTYGSGGIAMVDRITGHEKGELQGDEIILTSGVTNNPRLRAEASRLNVAGGGRSFASGGTLVDSRLPSANTTDQAQSNMDVLIASVNQVNNSIVNFNRTLKAYVVLQEINDAQDTLSAVTNDAKL
jgi:hypothetical protein